MPSRLCVFLRENDYRKHFSLEVSIHAPAFPLSLFGAGLPLQVGGSGATRRSALEKKMSFFRRSNFGPVVALASTLKCLSLIHI